MSITKSKELFVMAIRQGQPPSFEKVDGTLKGMQSFVGGLIEVVRLGVEDYLVVCNEEGKFIDGLKPTLNLGYDVVMGDCFICKDSEDGELTSLTNNDMTKLIMLFSKPK